MGWIAAGEIRLPPGGGDIPFHAARVSGPGRFGDQAPAGDADIRPAEPRERPPRDLL